MDDKVNASTVVERKYFEKVENLFNFLAPWNGDIDHQRYLFRGHEDSNYKLVPTALRASNFDKFWSVVPLTVAFEHQREWNAIQMLAEYELLRKFYKTANEQGLPVPHVSRIRDRLHQQSDVSEEFWGKGGVEWLPNDLRELAGLAQHYGIPTRLLDWTHDVYVALYFAFSGAIAKEGDMALWAIDKERLFELEENDQVNCGIKFITPSYSENPNLRAQKGVLSLWPVSASSFWKENWGGESKEQTLILRTPLDELVEQSLLSYGRAENIFKFIILPCSEAKKGLRILTKMGYGASRIFPGYEGVAKHVLMVRSYGKDPLVE